MPTETKRYLGDGAYAEVDDGRMAIVLTTENGLCATNTIVMEREVLAAFLDFLTGLGIIRWSPGDGR